MKPVEIRIVDKDSPPPFAELTGKEVVVGSLDRMAVVQGGMESGKPSVGFLIDLPDGRILFVETSADIFEGMAGIVRGARQKWGE